MTTPAETPRPNYLPGLGIGIIAGLGITICRSIAEALTPQLGKWPAIGVAVVAWAIAIIIAIVVMRKVSPFLKRKKDAD